MVLRVKLMGKILWQILSFTDKNGLTKYECPECGKVFEGITKLNAHMNHLHTFQNIIFPNCGKEFNLKQR